MAKNESGIDRPGLLFAILAIEIIVIVTGLILDGHASIQPIVPVSSSTPLVTAIQTATPTQNSTISTRPTGELKVTATQMVTLTPNLASDINDQLSLLRGETQALRDQISDLKESQVPASELRALGDQLAGLTQPRQTVETPLIVLAIILAIAGLSFGGYVLTHGSSSESGNVNKKTKYAGGVALLTAIIAGIFIPISQNLPAYFPTPIWPCAILLERCGYVAPATAIQPTPSFALSATPTATAFTPTPTSSPTKHLTPTSPPPSAAAPPTVSSLSPAPPAVINNYIYTCQCCTSGRTTTNKTPCATPTVDP